MTSATAVTTCSLVAGGVCLALYVAEVVASLMVKPVQSAKDVASQAAIKARDVEADLDALTKLINALSSLSDSLAKAGPALTSLIGAVLFFAIAAVSSGALISSVSADQKQDAGARPGRPPVVNAATAAQ